MGDKKINIPESLRQAGLTPQEEHLEVLPRHRHLFIGLPKVNHNLENRIALTPWAVRVLTSQGHRVVVESGAGLRSHFSDHEYSEAGAEIEHSREKVFEAHILIRVAPLELEEITLCHPNQIVITPIHLPTLSADYLFRLKEKRVIALAVDYVKDTAGDFPFVRIMSEMAGISAFQTAAELLTVSGGGRGVLLGGITGVPPAKVVILGSGIVAEYAVRAALGCGAEVRVFDNHVRKLMRLQHHIGRQVFTSTIDPYVLRHELMDADVAIGAMHSGHGRTPVVVSEDMVEQMRKGSVIVDVSIDQGGCFATSRLTTHDQPTFRAHDVIHYCVPNIASRIPRTGSAAFSNILSSLLFRADETHGMENLIRQSPGLQNGVYVYKSCLTNEYMSQRFNMKFTDLPLLLASNF
jgi:alanine dehydrogenase